MIFICFKTILKLFSNPPFKSFIDLWRSVCSFNHAHFTIWMVILFIQFIEASNPPSRIWQNAPSGLDTRQTRLWHGPTHVPKSHVVPSYRSQPLHPSYLQHPHFSLICTLFSGPSSHKSPAKAMDQDIINSQVGSRFNTFYLGLILLLALNFKFEKAWPCLIVSYTWIGSSVSEKVRKSNLGSGLDIQWTVNYYDLFSMLASILRVCLFGL